ncbi:MAG: MarR family transcriptional regulator [Cyclobacteriaceae bacterium]|nr:MarR family transcriptional regulator [Cyclobacteriaceae bacterium]
MTKLDQVFFFTLEKSIKAYRQFAQKQIDKANIDITIDQWLVLKSVQDWPDISQHQIAENVFKDYASVTRMIELLVKKGYLTRALHNTDRRRFNLIITKKGDSVLDKLIPIITANRKQALKSLTNEEVENSSAFLNRIIKNCKSD